MTWHELEDYCEQILADIERLPERAADFAESANETVVSIRDWIVDQKPLTKRQLDALNNIEDGVSKWLS